MSNKKHALRLSWHAATSALPYGVQNVFLDVLGLVADEQKKDLVYGADYRDGGACLVNAAGNMLTSSGGNGIPSLYFGDVVSAFDSINSLLFDEGVNTTKFVSPLAAEILMQWFGERKEAPDLEAIDAAKQEAFAKNLPYREPSDAEMAEAFQNMLNNPIQPSTVTPFDVPVTNDRDEVDSTTILLKGNSDATALHQDL